MKELVCDMCGSNNIIKQDGLFVCQACNTKYSIEEARKMMFGETVEVEGTVKIDSSDELNNLYQLARRAKDAGDKKYALEYYEKILIKDPNSWEAQFYVALFRLTQYDTLNQRIIDDFNSSIKSTLLIVKEKIIDDEEKRPILADMTNQIIDVTTTTFNNLSEYRASINNIPIKENCLKNMICWINALYSYGDVLVEVDNKFSNFAIGCWEEAIICHESTLKSFRLRKMIKQKKIIKNYRAKIQQYNSE